jgi:hypothetical protein
MNIALFGWIATAVQTTSYFVPKASTLKKIQAVAACLWIVYGVKMGANPVIVANLIVGGVALLTSFRNRPSNTNSTPFVPVLANNPETEPPLKCD